MLALLAAAAAAFAFRDLPPALLLAGTALGGALAGLVLNIVLLRSAAAIEQEQLGPAAPQPRRTLLPGVAALIDAHHRLLAYQQQTIEKLSDEADVLVERYEVLTENLAAAIVIRDTGGRILYCSPYTEVLTGFSTDEIYGCQDEDFLCRIVHPDDREQYRKALRVSAFGEAFQFRYRFFHKTGIEMWAETRAVPIMDEHGEVTSSLSINFDVTGLIRRQQLIEEKNRDLEDFSYMISHDLKAPIFTVKGMLQILREDFGGGLGPDGQETMRHIEQAVSRLEQLVQSVVEYSRVGNRETFEEAVDLNQVLADIRAELQTRLAACGAELTGAALPAVRGDRLKLYQIFSNLLGNAVKYRAAERRLEIEISEAPHDNERFVKICVRDNGLGIPAGRLKDIFRPFQRAHGREIEGSGIGLACVKKLVTGFGGEVGVESVEGAGSRFYVTLPRADRSLESEGRRA